MDCLGEVRKSEKNVFWLKALSAGTINCDKEDSWG